ncbi:MAG: SGNH/GDSL hydrolase family protein [Saprospiraceae bacterium]
MKDRRNFLKKASLAALGSSIFPSFSAKANPISLAAGQTILFQGDSITDAGRDKGKYYPNDASGMGNGYVHHIVTELLGRFPEQDFRCYNRGISGHKVFQLADRWEDDCLQLKPDVLSILIGVNDFWHTLSSGYKGTVEVYALDLKKLLDRTKKELPNVKLILCEPFMVKGGTALDDRWGAFAAYQQVNRKIAADFGAAYVPFQQVFDDALNVKPASYWCPDGVHPSLAGAYLMGKKWMEVFEKM